MSLGTILRERGLITQPQLDAAIARQKITGGREEDHLIALGFLAREQLLALLQEPPPEPRALQETGLDPQFLLKIVLKAMMISGLQTVPDLARELRLPRRMVDELLQGAKKETLVEVRGAAEGSLAVLRYALTGLGRERAAEALAQSQYVGPAPVSLAAYREQVQKQTVTNEKITAEELSRTLSHLVLAPGVLRQVGPAINSGKPVLLYGPSGNGKTSIAEAVGQAFQQMVYVPYCIVVGEQIIKVFDPIVHEEVPPRQSTDDEYRGSLSLPQPEFDPRWVRCRRPVVISGGELTLDMLDLRIDPISHDYEAPLQVKAMNGVFVVDDFGRQLVRPHDLLNRWIVPLERKVDYLTLHTGKKFDLPFDEVVIFSTNLSPEELMDVAFLRRVHYKLRIDRPSLENYKTLFRRVSALRGLELPEELLAYIMDTFYAETRTAPAAYHPKFILEHVIASCNFAGIPPQLDLERVKDALQNLQITESPATQGA
jgi:hypothetical protein